MRLHEGCEQQLKNAFHQAGGRRFTKEGIYYEEFTLQENSVCGPVRQILNYSSGSEVLPLVRKNL